MAVVNLAAASTLPKTVGVWKINGCGRSFAPYSMDVEAVDTPELFARIRALMEGSFNRITIVYETREVPA